MKTKHLRKPDYTAVVEARRKQRRAREHAAMSLQIALANEYRATHGLAIDVPIGAADQALLDSAVSARLEIARTTSQMVKGFARPASVKSLGFARSELRRCLRALNLIGDSSESATNGDSGPPPNATDEEKREWSRKYVVNALAEGKSAAP